MTKSEREMRHLRGSQLTMILQDPMMSLNPLFTIGEQIAEPLRIHRHMRAARLVERIKELLRGCGFRHLKCACGSIRTR